MRWKLPILFLVLLFTWGATFDILWSTLHAPLATQDRQNFLEFLTITCHPVFWKIICLIPSILSSVSHQLSRCTVLSKSQHDVLVAAVALRSTIIMSQFPLLCDPLKSIRCVCCNLIVLCFIPLVKRLHSTGQKPDLHESLSTLST